MSKWMLFISPYESVTSDWEVKIFDSEKELDDYIYGHDLTKEYYATTVEEMLNIIRESKKWENQ